MLSSITTHVRMTEQRDRLCLCVPHPYLLATVRPQGKMPCCPGQPNRLEQRRACCDDPRLARAPSQTCAQVLRVKFFEAFSLVRDGCSPCSADASSSTTRHACEWTLTPHQEARVALQMPGALIVQGTSSPTSTSALALASKPNDDLQDKPRRTRRSISTERG